ncbi:hypothetical protein ACWEKT_16820 [Nocardia takedensis]
MSTAATGWRARTRGFGTRAAALTAAARRELLLRGAEATATVLAVRPGHRGTHFTVRVHLDGERPYETRFEQQVCAADLEWMGAGDTVACRVDPGDRARVVLYLPDSAAVARPEAETARILADGRRAEATVLAATPVAAGYSARADPVLRLDLELRAWDEPTAWRVRVVQAVPLVAIGLIDLGARVETAFFAIDRGESVAVDWAATLGED